MPFAYILWPEPAQAGFVVNGLQARLQAPSPPIATSKPVPASGDCKALRDAQAWSP
jgi:hypothetical protein